jgi:MFS family permease
VLETTEATGQNRFRDSLAPLRGRPFRYQFGAQTISTIGSTLTPVALAIGLITIDAGAGTLGLAMAAYSTPVIIFVLVGGVWADRLPRQRIMVTADLVRAVVQCTVGALLLAESREVWAYVVLQFVAGTATAFYHPASTGLTADTVPAHDLQRANALLSLTRSLAGSLGPLVASGLALGVGAGWALVADGLSFLGSAFLLSRLSLLVRRVPVRDRFLTELRAGATEVRQRSWVWSSILVFAASNLAFAALYVVGPDVLISADGGEVAWGIVIATFSVGQGIGDVLALRVQPQRPLLAARLIELLQAPLLVALALDASLPWLVAGAVLGGIATTYPDTLWYTALQQHLPDEMLSRVSSYDWMGSLVLRPVGYAVAATAAGAFGPETILASVAVLVVVSRLAGAAVPGIRRLRRLEPATI